LLNEHVKPLAPAGRGALVRRLSRSDALAIGVGSVIGTGIFRTTGEVLRGAGGFTGATLIWVGIGAVSGIGALVYAGMASRVPEAGGPYAYVREAFGRYPAFLDGGLSALVSIPARHAAAIGVIGEVIARLTGVERPRAWAVLTLGCLVALNLPGVRAGAAAQRLFTVAKLVLVAGVIALAIVSSDAPERAAEMTPRLPPVSLATAVAAAWYSYLGWQDAALLTEEMKAPARDLRLVLVATVGVVAAAYIGVHTALFFGLRGGAAARGALPAVALARRVLGPVGETVMTVGLLVSMIGGAAESLLVRPRVLFALARDGLAPRGLTYVNRGGTPALAMVAHTGLVLVLVLTGTFRHLLALLAFTQALTGLAESSSAFVLVAPRPRRASSRALTAAFVAANAALCALVAYEEPAQVGYALAALVLLTVVYPFLRGGAAGRAGGE
jgi:APA family basic amino acid/polyamine antiporter